MTVKRRLVGNCAILGSAPGSFSLEVKNLDLLWDTWMSRRDRVRIVCKTTLQECLYGVPIQGFCDYRACFFVCDVGDEVDDGIFLLGIYRNPR